MLPHLASGFIVAVFCGFEKCRGPPVVNEVADLVGVGKSASLLRPTFSYLKAMLGGGELYRRS
jgi:hypothetical protein